MNIPGYLGVCFGNAQKECALGAFKIAEGVQYLLFLTDTKPDSKIFPCKTLFLLSDLLFQKSGEVLNSREDDLYMCLDNGRLQPAVLAHRSYGTA